MEFTDKQPFADGTTPVQHGQIAEEVAEVLPALVAPGRDGEIETVKSHLLPTLLRSEVQRLERERAAQETRLERHAEEVATLREMVLTLQREVTTGERAAQPARAMTAPRR